MIINLKVDTKTLQLLEENWGLNLYDFELGNAFLDKTPKTEGTKEKNRQILHQNLKLLYIKQQLSRKWKDNTQNRRKYLNNAGGIRGADPPTQMKIHV